MARELNINDIQFIPIINKKVFINGLPSLLKGKKYLVIDEIYDTGNTFSKVLDSLRGFDIDFAFLMSRYRNSNATLVAKILNHNRWVVFPWERKSK
jgi:hypoxanthine phosphoribosyltransferase